MMNAEPWQPACAEYFRDFADGRFDHLGQFWFIQPKTEVRISADGGHLIVGGAGCDGIEFCFRRGVNGVWAYYQIEDEYLLVAPDLRALESGWTNGSITV